MKILFVLILYFMVCSSYSAELIENEPSSSTQNTWFFGYFGNLWNKKQLPSTPPTHLSSEQPVGIFDHVKNWMNVIRDKMPGKIQATTSSVNFTSILKTKSVRKIHSTSKIKNRTAVSLSISSSSVGNMKRRADKDILGIAESSAQFPDASDSISSPKNIYSSYEYFIGRHEGRTTSVKQEQSNANISSSTVPASTETNNTKLNLFASTVDPDMKLNPFVNLEKHNNVANLSSSNSDGSDYTLNRPTTKKHFKGYKLTPLFIAFYNADDLTGNSSKRAVQFPLPVFSKYSTRIRTRMTSVSRRPRRRKSTKSESTSNSMNSGSNLSNSI